MQNVRSHTQATVFNPMQLQLLRMFSYVKTDEQMNEVKKALSSYFFHRVEEGMDALVASGQWSEDQENAIMKEHLHTPYVY